MDGDRQTGGRQQGIQAFSQGTTWPQMKDIPILGKRLGPRESSHEVPRPAPEVQDPPKDGPKEKAGTAWAEDTHQKATHWETLRALAKQAMPRPKTGLLFRMQQAASTWAGPGKTTGGRGRQHGAM